MSALKKLALICTIALFSGVPTTAQIKQATPKTIFRDSSGNLISNNEFVDLRLANPREKKDPATKTVLADGTIEFKLDAVPQEGTVAPIFDATTIDGKSITAAELRGKVLVLNFWFIGCPGCLTEIPKLNTLAEKYKSESNVVFIAAALDSADSLKQFLIRERFDYNIVSAENSMINLFSFAGFPRNIVIGKDGKIAYWRSTVYAWEKFDSVIKAELERN